MSMVWGQEVAGCSSALLEGVGWRKPPRWGAEEVPTAAIAQGGGGVAEVGFERGGPGGEDPSEGLMAVW